MSKLKLFNADNIRSAVLPIAQTLPSMNSKTVAPQEPGTIEEYDAVIRTLWTNAQQTFIDIGNHLDRAQKTLPPDDFKSLCDRLPFGKSARSQLMSAYRLVESKKIPDGCEQAGYATIYLCGTLTEEERLEAIRIGTIAPNMSRSKIIEFKKMKRLSDDKSSRSRRDYLEQEISRHERIISELKEELSLL
ncbi:DUF3486 family protein [Azospirillaceae bacterium]